MHFRKGQKPDCREFSGNRLHFGQIGLIQYITGHVPAEKARPIRGKVRSDSPEIAGLALSGFAQITTPGFAHCGILPEGLAGVTLSLTRCIGPTSRAGRQADIWQYPELAIARGYPNAIDIFARVTHVSTPYASARRCGDPYWRPLLDGRRCGST